MVDGRSAPNPAARLGDAMVRRCDSADDGMVQRYDRAELRPLHRTTEGYLFCEGDIAKPGILEYRQPDGSVIRELIAADQLHRADSLGTMARKPVTLEHPDEDVTPANVGALGVGDVDGEIEVVEGGYVRIRMCIRRQDAIDAIMAGKRELSPGYRCRIDPTPGVHPEFGPYDQAQVGRVYNHHAICDKARGGATIHLRADSADAVAVTSLPPGKPHMNALLVALLTKLNVKHLDSEAAATDPALQALQALMEKAGTADTLKAENEKLTADVAKLTADMAPMKEKADKYDASMAKAEKVVNPPRTPVTMKGMFAGLV
jgi:hypothetical protein